MSRPRWCGTSGWPRSGSWPCCGPRWGWPAAGCSTAPATAADPLREGAGGQSDGRRNPAEVVTTSLSTTRTAVTVTAHAVASATAGDDLDDRWNGQGSAGSAAGSAACCPGNRGHLSPPPRASRTYTTSGGSACRTTPLTPFHRGPAVRLAEGLHLRQAGTGLRRRPGTQPDPSATHTVSRRGSTAGWGM